MYHIHACTLHTECIVLVSQKSGFKDHRHVTNFYVDSNNPDDLIVFTTKHDHCTKITTN
jgi:hypothetical protein